MLLILFFYYSRDLPDYSQLNNYQPPSITRIYSRDGKLIEEYALEKRFFVPINNIPTSLIEAFLAAEDKNFYEHHGIDFLGIIRAAILNISNILRNRRVEGASTITQQVVKNFLLTSEVSIERKIKEAILAYSISNVFTKDQILELYLNQTFFGRGAYGVAMAAKNYFNKSVDELSIAESAFIAGLPKAPSNFNLKHNYNRVKERRDYVIIRMLEEGYLTIHAAEEAIKSPIILKTRDTNDVLSAGYFAEQVREEVIKILGDKEKFYTAGLTIITTLDSKYQKIAQNALRTGINKYDIMYRGYKGKVGSININHWRNILDKTSFSSSINLELVVVLEITNLHLVLGFKNGIKKNVLFSDILWFEKKQSSEFFKANFQKGDVIVLKGKDDKYDLVQIPEINGGIIVINPINGKILASVGGYDFTASKFDRVNNALRQPGSLSKTFVYIAALENGIKPNTIFDDGAIEIFQGHGLPVWSPKNYSKNFLGLITMRTGLEQSRNLITVRVAQAVGISRVQDIMKRFGINDTPKPFYSMALGSLETTLAKITTAYATIANNGQEVKPYFIELIKDRNGKIIYHHNDNKCINCDLSFVKDLSNFPIDEPMIISKKPNIILDEATNYQILSFLLGAVERGTASGVKKLGKIIAAKSGTTNDSKDAWFVGFTPEIVVGVYIGYDIPKSMGKRATGSSVAMPVFIDFMDKISDDINNLNFKIPDRIKLIPINKNTGEISNSGDIMESFKIDELPNEALKQREYDEFLYNDTYEAFL